jgi:quercetin dioxygenase-like cupin family protein
MKITRSGSPTDKGSAEWFTGDVYVDSLVVPEGDSRVSGGIVHFTPGARTAWHTHPLGQTIFVLEGVGRCQRRGGPVVEIRPGDRVFFEPDEEHWHGATTDRFMTHVAVLQTDGQGISAVWGEHVQDHEIAG